MTRLLAASLTSSTNRSGIASTSPPPSTIVSGQMRCTTFATAMPILYAAVRIICSTTRSPFFTASASTPLRIFEMSVPALCTQVGRFAAIRRLGNFRGNGQPAGLRFQTPATTAAAQVAVVRDFDVPDLHGRNVLAAHDLTVVHTAATNARSWKDPQRPYRALWAAPNWFSP